MLERNAIADLITKLRERAFQDPSAAVAAALCLRESFGEDLNEPADEIAQTILELLEPERLGVIRCMICDARFGTCEHSNKRSDA